MFNKIIFLHLQAVSNAYHVKKKVVASNNFGIDKYFTCRSQKYMKSYYIRLYILKFYVSLRILNGSDHEQEARISARN